jgi:hypothetical protein
MSIHVMDWVWQHAQADPSELLVLLAIADNADDDGTNAWPSKQTLARKCRMSERNVHRITGRLAAAGQLLIDARKAPNGRGNRYSIPLERVSGLPARGHGMSPHGDAERTPVSPGEVTSNAGVTIHRTVHREDESGSEEHRGPAPFDPPPWSFPPDRLNEARSQLRTSPDDTPPGPSEALG